MKTRAKIVILLTLVVQGFHATLGNRVVVGVGGSKWHNICEMHNI